MDTSAARAGSTPKRNSHNRFRTVHTAGGAAAFMLLLAGASSAQTVDTTLWVANGPVFTVVRDAGTVYIGGGFTRVGPATGGGVPIDAATGGLPSSFPK